MKITIIGTGYVGLVTGACFAEFGFNVICVDKNLHKINDLQQGKIPIYEPGLKNIVASNQSRLTFTTDIKLTIPSADIVFIAVGTPMCETKQQINMDYIIQAVTEIAPLLGNYTVIVNKSTAPIGTVKKVTEIINDINPHADFDVVSNPEFLREGSAIDDFMHPDRVVIGYNTQKARNIMKKLYQPLEVLNVPFVYTTPDAAELIKYASNAFLATKITFINQMADICEKCDADINSIALGIGLDSRIGSKFLNAGPGYGGSCFPKDTLALKNIGSYYNAEPSIVSEVIKYNNKRKKSIANKIISICGNDIKEKKIAILGLTFKPDTDDMRDSPSLDIIPILQQHHAQISCFDPQGMTNARKYFKNITYNKDTYEAIAGADVVVILTEWNEFRALDMQKLKDIMKTPVIIDLRNIYNYQELYALNIRYYCVGYKMN